jgi:hypothetical protein
VKEEDMANEPGGGPSEAPSNPNELPQHPLVERLKPDPSQPAKRVVVLTGLPGRSDRNGFQRLYLTTKLNYYAEFLASDIVNAEAIPADQSPFPGHEATRVSVPRNATIHYIRERSPQPVDEFDLDVRLGAPAAALQHLRGYLPDMLHGMQPGYLRQHAMPAGHLYHLPSSCHMPANLRWLIR